MSDGADTRPSTDAPARPPDEAVRVWLETRGRRFGHHVGGVTTDPDAGPTLLVATPWDQRALASVRRGTPADVDAAVAAAREGLPRWAALGPAGRARHLDHLAGALEADIDLLAALQALDAGVPVRHSRQVHLPEALAHLRHHGARAWSAAVDGRGSDEPGVVGHLLPWAGPLRTLVRSVAPVLAAGHAVVVKPSGHTPLTALRFAELCHEAGLPWGVVDVVTGDDETGTALAGHPGVDTLAFFGSRDGARAVRRATAGRWGTLTVELATTPTFLVFDDADVDAAADAVVHTLATGLGSPWSAGSRLLAQEAVAESLAERVRARMSRLRVGDPLDPSTDLAAVAPPGERTRLEAALREALDGGATVWSPPDAAPPKGWGHPPVLCMGPAPSAVLATGSVPGPVVVLDSFRTPDEAAVRAGPGRAGRSVSVWTRAIDVAQDAVESLGASVTWINDGPRSDPTTQPLRWMGAGGHGRREGILGAPPDDPAVRQGGPGRGADAGPAEAGGALPDGDALADEAGATMAAARAAQPAWAARPVQERAAVLRRVATALSRRREEVARQLDAAHAASGASGATGTTMDDRPGGAEEVDRTVARLDRLAAHAEAWEGRIRRTPDGAVALLGRAPFGVVVAVAPPEPLLAGVLSLAAPLAVVGNAVVLVAPPWRGGADPAALLASLLDEAGAPPGVVTVLAGSVPGRIATLADRSDVDGIWYVGPADRAADVARRSAAHLTPTWAPFWRGAVWTDADPATDGALLRAATRPATVWLPGGA